MIRFTNSIDIAADSAFVFDYLVDLDHVPEWNWAIDSTEKLTSGPVQVGTMYRQVRSVPRPGVENLEITSLDPGRRLELAGVLGPFPSRLSYEVESIPGGTRLTNDVELDPPIPLGPVGQVLGKRIRGSVADNLAVLKDLLEGRAGEGA